jgi:hypothetical protein
VAESLWSGTLVSFEEIEHKNVMPSSFAATAVPEDASLAEAELPRNPDAAEVAGGRVELQAVNPKLAKGEVNDQARGLGHKTPTDKIAPKPIADLGTPQRRLVAFDPDPTGDLIVGEDRERPRRLTPPTPGSIRKVLRRLEIGVNRPCQPGAKLRQGVLDCTPDVCCETGRSRLEPNPRSEQGQLSPPPQSLTPGRLSSAKTNGDRPP